MGTLPPMNEADWKINYDEYMQSPQGKTVNSDMTLSGFKNIFWWEWIHRLWARLFAPVFLIPFFYFLVRFMFSWRLVLKLLFAFVLGGLQGVLGWFMVSTGLKDVPWVSPYSLCAHLLLATILAGYLLWLALEQFYPSSGTQGSLRVTPLRRFSKIMLFIIFVQLGLGAFMAGGIAPAAIWFPTWPKIGSEWIPQNVFLLSNPQWHSLLENPAFVQLMHRNTAYLLVILIVWFWLKRKKLSGNSAAQKLSSALLIMIFIQATLGIITVLSSSGSVPVLWGVLHQAGGLITFTLAVMLVYFLSSAKNISESNQPTAN